ncbi:MAG: glycosyltransferase family 2 protein, partial [Boseongicola sp.]
LARAVKALKRCAGPGIYGGRTIITDQNLKPLRSSLMFRREPSFGNALVQNIAGGNTMVVNRPALDILQPASRYADEIIAHDWWCYQMVTGTGGKMIYDEEPCLLYRQHACNQIGTNDSVTATLERIKLLFQGQFANWTSRQSAALIKSRRWMSSSAMKQLNLFIRSRSYGPLSRILLLRSSGIVRQTRRGTLMLWLAAGLGRL